MEPVSSESQSKIRSSPVVSQSEPQQHILSSFSHDISPGLNSERCHSQQYHQRHQQILQRQQSNQQNQQENLSKHEVQDQNEVHVQPILSPFPGQQEHLDEVKNWNKQNHSQLHQMQLNKQLITDVNQREEQQKHQQEFQVQFQEQVKYQQQEVRKLKQQEQHQQDQGLTHQQLHLHGKDQQHGQHLQLKMKTVEDKELQHEAEQRLQYELEMFSPVSQHVRNVLDLYLKTKASDDIATDMHNVQYSHRSDQQATISSQCHSLGRSLPSVYPGVLAHFPIPVSTNESSKIRPDCLSSPLARENPQTISKPSDGDRENSHETVGTKINNVSEDQHANHNAYTVKVERMLKDADDVAGQDISHPLIPKSPLCLVEKDVGSGSSADSLKTNKSQYEEMLTEYSSDDKLDEKDIDMEAIDKDKVNIGETIDSYMCLCNEDLLKYSQNKSKKYVCGGCFNRFISICHLHKHLEKHGSGGSYHFDHVSQTAYPKYDTFCSFTQTDDDHLGRKDEFILIEDENDASDFKSAETTNTDNVVGEEVQSITDTEVQEQKLQPMRKCRKRKQDYPKPTKPRFVNTRKGEKGRTVRRRSDLKQKKDTDYCIAYEDFENYHTESSTIGLIEAKGNLETDTNSEHQNHEERQGTECFEIKQEVPLDESESHAVTKSLQKRGRPKKSDASYEKNVVKKRKMMKKEMKVSKELIRKEKSVGVDQQETQIELNSDEAQNMTMGIDETLEEDEIDVKQKVQKNAKKYQMCDVCGLPVPKYNYVYHMRRHTGEKPFVCDKCGKTFAHRRFLIKHMLIHAEDKPWKCNLCSAQFCQKSEYNMHMNAHEGNRPYECKVCEMKFLSKSMLNTHQANVHMGITRFECDVCHRRFFKRSSLNVHQATHFEATMKCNFCDRMFKDRAGLKRHERIHTGEKRFRCHICNHEFIQSTPYWVHMEKRHHMKRETVKNMLKDIRENNKRFGIRTEINVLPKDVDHLPSPQEEAGETSVEIPRNLTKSKSDRSSERSGQFNTSGGSVQQVQAFQQLNSRENVEAQKLYTSIKVPSVYSSNVSESVTSSTYSSEVNTDTEALQQHYRFVLPEHDTVPPHSTNCETGSSSAQETVTTGSQSLDLPANLPIPVSLGSIGISMSSLHHGFIGLNPLQQALDYSNSIPNTGTYTDISTDRVTNQPQ